MNMIQQDLEAHPNLTVCILKLHYFTQQVYDLFINSTYNVLKFICTDDGCTLKSINKTC